MSFYGSWIGVNEQVQLQSQDPILNQAAIRLGVQMRITEDEISEKIKEVATKSKVTPGDEDTIQKLELVVTKPKSASGNKNV